MKNQKLSDWISADIKPTMKGWYEREYMSTWMGKMHDYWDGKRWYVGNGDSANVPAAGARRRWRGLAEKPEK